ncbi:hypothetical protein [Bacillus toyonensis]|uniref:hypothetical protein n=1 Tax=Bacillus toyonensis TaxID=155322 RepID=UPI000BF935C2|nr:hypothetical protein [Bacillus toyonensis]PGF05310.1 hypothetical protein COM61_02550 [Bacillus toyonensis]
MEKTKVSYESRAEVMLRIQLNGLEEDIELSKGRIEGLKRAKDDVALRMERGMYQTFVEKKKLLEKLIKLEEKISSGVEHFVTVGYKDKDGTKWGEETYHAEVKEQVVAV